MSEGQIFFLPLPTLNKKQTSPLGGNTKEIKIIFKKKKKGNLEVTEAALTFCPCQMPPHGSETPLPAQPEERSPFGAMVELGPGGPCTPCAHCAGSHPALFNTRKTWMQRCLGVIIHNI